MHKMLDVVFRRNRVEPEIPVCPDHRVDMRLRGKQGRPTRFTAQTEEEYTLIYFARSKGATTLTRGNGSRHRLQCRASPPTRPSFARRDQAQQDTL